MNVLFFSTAFPQPQDPSRAPYNLHRCEALSKLHKVAVVSPVSWRERHAAGGADSETRQQGSLRVLYPTFYYPAGFLRGSHAWCLYRSIRRRVRELIREFRPDVMLSYWTYPDGDVALRFAHDAGIPGIAFAGGSDVLLVQTEQHAGLRVRSVLERADGIATVSHDLKAKMSGLGIAADKIVVLPPAVDEKMFCPGDRSAARVALNLNRDERMILWVGRMVEVKGLIYLLDAAKILADAGTGFRLCLIGDGPLKASLMSRCRELGLEERVMFAGRALQPELPQWYRAADVITLPSLSEGTPNVLLEARACGTPFVATAVGGIPPLAVDGDTLVPPADPASLASALNATLSRPTRLRATAGPVGGWDETAVRLTQQMEGILRLRSGPSSTVLAVDTP
jgi:glycosyltransferase involved in cell wall biosynthesis